MTGLESDGAKSIAKTDAALGIRKDLLGKPGRLHEEGNRPSR
jgi:hypothetical protein